LNDVPKASMDSRCVAVAPPIGTAYPRRIENDRDRRDRRDSRDSRGVEEEVQYELRKHPSRYGRPVEGQRRQRRLRRLRRRYVVRKGVRRGNVPVASISHARRGGRGIEVG